MGVALRIKFLYRISFGYSWPGHFPAGTYPRMKNRAAQTLPRGTAILGMATCLCCLDLGQKGMMNLAGCNLSGSPTSHWEHCIYPRSHGITDEIRRVTGVSVAGADNLLLQRDRSETQVKIGFRLLLVLVLPNVPVTLFSQTLILIVYVGMGD